MTIAVDMGRKATKTNKQIINPYYGRKDFILWANFLSGLKYNIGAIYCIGRMEVSLFKQAIIKTKQFTVTRQRNGQTDRAEDNPLLSQGAPS